MPRIRVFASLILMTISPAIAMLLNATFNQAFLTFGSWLGWVGIVVTVLIMVQSYVVSFRLSSRNDALVPAKRHAYVLLFTIPPMVFLYEFLLSNREVFKFHAIASASEQELTTA